MDKINRKLLKSITDDEDSKGRPTVSNAGLVVELTKCVNNMTEFVKKEKEHFTANWVRSQDYLFDQKGQPKKHFKYSAKMVVMIEYGDQCNELSFLHPGIIIADVGDRVFVIPCTSTKAPKNRQGNLLKGYYEGREEEGFYFVKTAILKEACFVDKGRITTLCDEQLSPGTYNEIYNKLFDLTFENKSYKINQLEKEIERLKVIIIEIQDATGTSGKGSEGVLSEVAMGEVKNKKK